LTIEPVRGLSEVLKKYSEIVNFFFYFHTYVLFERLRFFNSSLNLNY
jgi:hypothetical protein